MIAAHVSGTNVAVGCEVAALLERADSRRRARPEDPVDGDSLSVRAEQVLQRPDGMLPIALGRQRPGEDVSGGASRRTPCSKCSTY